LEAPQWARSEDVLHAKRTADRLFGDKIVWSVLGAKRNQLPIAAMVAAPASRLTLPAPARAPEGRDPTSIVKMRPWRQRRRQPSDFTHQAPKTSLKPGHVAPIAFESAWEKGQDPHKLLG
jgi:hypothetical protein